MSEQIGPEAEFHGLFQAFEAGDTNWCHLNIDLGKMVEPTSTTLPKIFSLNSKKS